MSEEYRAEEVPQIIHKFNITNGNTGEITISDQLLDSYEKEDSSFFFGRDRVMVSGANSGEIP